MADFMTSPNKMVAKSVSNALYAGVIYGLVFTSYSHFIDRHVSSFLIDYATGLFPQWNANLIIGIHFGMIGFWLFGGISYIGHMALRLIHYGEEHTPWKNYDFYDFAVDRMLLRKIGGTYSFIHPTLQEHFAGLKINTSRSSFSQVNIARKLSRVSYLKFR